MASASRALGAYGFRLSGLADAAAHLHPAPADWPELHLRFGPAPANGAAREPGSVEIGDSSAELWLAEAGRITVAREPLTVTFATPVPLSTDAVLHPFLGLPAAVAADWLGRPSLHGGAFAHDGRAWLLLGDRGAGKSATLAALLHGGAPILSDDVLIVDGPHMFAGPRAIDLRADTAQMGGGEPLGMVGNRERWRLRPPPAPAMLPVGGLIYLEWGERATVEAVDGIDRLRRLLQSTAMPARSAHSRTVLELAGLPATRFVRPRNLDLIADTAARLVASLPL